MYLLMDPAIEKMQLPRNIQAGSYKSIITPRYSPDVRSASVGEAHHHRSGDRWRLKLVVSDAG